MSANAGPLIIALAIVTVLLLAALGVLAFRARRARALMSAASQFADIVQSAKYTDRVRASSPAMPFAEKANLLLERIAMKDLMISERERSLVGLLGGLHEAVAVHRETIVFANDHFAALVAQPSAQLLIGKSMADLVHPEYTELVRGHLQRSLSGAPSLDRL